MPQIRRVNAQARLVWNTLDQLLERQKTFFVFVNR